MRFLLGLPQSSQQHQIEPSESGVHPDSPPNPPELLVIEVDGGRWQGKEKDPLTGGRWHEHKVCTVVKYAPGDSREKPPRPLVASVVAISGVPEQRLADRLRGGRSRREAVLAGGGGNGAGSAGTGALNRRAKRGHPQQVLEAGTGCWVWTTICRFDSCIGTG